MHCNASVYTSDESDLKTQQGTSEPHGDRGTSVNFSFAKNQVNFKRIRQPYLTGKNTIV